MKFFITSVLILCHLMSSSDALKDAICGLPHSKNGQIINLNGTLVRRVCLSYGLVFSYDADNKKCVRFVYGGCGGNSNIFPSEEACKEKCVE